MPADPSPAVVLLAPALDTGASAASAASGPPGSPPPGAGRSPAEPPSGAGARQADGAPASSDALADAVDGGTFERRPLDAWPWEARLMALLGLLDPGAPTDAVRASVPAARLLGPDDLERASSGAGTDAREAAAGGRLVVADPVSLTPGRDEATLAPPEALALAPDEADALIEAANALLADDGIALARGASGRWYLAGLDVRGLDAPPTHFLARREAGAHLPGSAEAAPWRRLMTELQMLWHAHPVNEARLERGAAAVNGVWFWGGAPVPEAPSGPASIGATPVGVTSNEGASDGAVSGAAASEGTPRPTVVTKNDLATALAGHAGAVVTADDGFDEALARAAGGSLLIVDTAAYAAWLANDAVALEHARARSLDAWLVPAARAVLDGRASSLVVAGGDGGEAAFVPAPRRSWLAGRFPGGLFPARLFARSGR